MIQDLWYKNTVIYSLDLETFMDSDGDGVGDFEGLMRRLDYLQWLGIGTIWLAPFYSTPNRDNGYDVSDFYSVDQRHGTLGDFVEFMHQARKRGFRVITDLVVNHTSSQHPWFQRSRKRDASTWRDWYIWSKKRPPDWKSGMVFPGVQESTWTYDKEARAYYFHRFYDFQPDLNMANPNVRTEVRRIMGFWLELGVAGFRVDALPFIVERPVPGEKRPAMHFDWITEMRRFAQWRRGDAVLLGEANVLPKDVARYFADGNDGVHMMFNFWVNQHLFYALATADVKPLISALRQTRKIPQGTQWAQFLRNHDELDLGRLDPERRRRVFERFGPEERMQLYGRGIRRRLAPMLGDPRLEQLAYSVLFSLPGTPVIRYGDEIGMGDDLSLRERDAVRTPMQWSDDPQAGFSTAERLVHPVVEEGVYAYRYINVEAQRRDPDSLLSWMARMIRLRHECPEIGWGTWDIVSTGAPGTLALRYDWRGTALIIVHNFSDTSRTVRVRTGRNGETRLADLLAETESISDRNGEHELVMDPYGFRWFRAGGLNYAIQRERR